MTWKEELLKNYCALRYLVMAMLLVFLVTLARLLDRFAPVVCDNDNAPKEK